jgi:hypothetical protein
MIKNKIKIISLLTVIFSVFGLVGYVSAANITYTDNVGVTIGAYDYYIGTGSSATSVVIDGVAGTLTVTVPASAYFSFTSPNRFILNDDAGLTDSCATDGDTLTINTASTVVITPATTTTCSLISGGGGGGGYVPSDTTAPTNTSVLINAGDNTTTSISTTLTLGATDATQMMISNDSAFTGGVWENFVASKSWTLTSGDGVKTVYAKFKDSVGNISSVVTDVITVSASGTIPSNPAFNTNPVVSGGTNASLVAVQKVTANLFYGKKSVTVKTLQQFLNGNGFLVSSYGAGSPGKETTTFGKATKSALAKFQKANGITPAAGYFGPKTRAFILGM